MHDDTTTWMLLTTTPLGGAPLAILAFLFVLVLRKRPLQKRQKACLIGSGLVIAIVLWAYTMGPSMFGGERINGHSFIPKTILPLLWGLATLHLWDAAKALWSRNGRAFLRATILPAAVVTATMFYAGQWATITVTAPQNIVQMDGTIDLSVETGLFTPPGYLLVSLQNAEYPKKQNDLGNLYTSSTGGPLLAQTIFVFPGTTTRLSVPADESWCAPTDEPIICKTGPGDYVVKATLYKVPGMSVGWPQTWPQKPLVDAKSAAFMLRDGEANPDEKPAELAMRDALQKRFKAATLGAFERIPNSITLQTFEHEDGLYCGTWSFPQPFLGGMEACITPHDTNGTTGYFYEQDTLVRRFDLRVPHSIYTPREAVIQAKKAGLVYGQTHSLHPTESTDSTNNDYELRTDLTLVEPTKLGETFQWKVGIFNRTLNPTGITVVLTNDGKACVKAIPWYEAKEKSTGCAMMVDVTPP